MTPKDLDGSTGKIFNVTEVGSSMDSHANTKPSRELAKEEPIDSLDDLLDIPNILRMASEKGADVSNPDSHIQLRIVFYDGNTETYPTTLSYNLVKQAIKDLFSRESSKREAEIRIDENTSDGYHTFKELYEFRLLYNAALFNLMFNNADLSVHKSKKHSDGELCFGGGWFVVVAQLPTGQITNHYELKDWDLFQIPERDKAARWDGHTAQDVAKRLRAYLESTKLRKGEDDD